MINLYKSKEDILRQIYLLKSEHGQLSNQIIDTDQFEDMLTRQENLVKKYGIELTDLIGFEDPLAEPKLDHKSQRDSEFNFNKKRSHLESLFYERIVIDQKENNITQYELMNVKPLTKALSGGYITQAILVGV